MEKEKQSFHLHGKNAFKDTFVSQTSAQIERIIWHPPEVQIVT